MILVGTSGYNYPEWKGSFYPADLPAAKMLPYYAGKFRTVEINYTFYRMPTPKLIAGWRAQVPPEFRFTLKAPKRITHDKRLRAGDVAEAVAVADRVIVLEEGRIALDVPIHLRRPRERGSVEVARIEGEILKKLLGERT